MNHYNKVMKEMRDPGYYRGRIVEMESIVETVQEIAQERLKEAQDIINQYNK